jgi:DNA-binding NarL/FixJ family response regulator
MERLCRPRFLSGQPIVPEKLRLVLADDHYLVREGTRSLLEDTGRIDVVATAGNAEELLAAVEQYHPGVVITDIRMPPSHSLEGIRAALAIRRSFPEVGVIALSQYVDGSYALELFKDGTGGLGYLLKERVGDLDELLVAIETVAAGGSTIDPIVVEALVESRGRATRSPLRHLSPRELDVLREMAQGKNNQGIADALYLSESAVEKHVGSIFVKLWVTEQSQISRRVAAVVTFLEDDSPRDS